MIVYHGSTEIIKNPDVVHSKKYLDFYKQNLENDIINAISEMRKIVCGRHLIFIILVNWLNKFQMTVME